MGKLKFKGEPKKKKHKSSTSLSAHRKQDEEAIAEDVSGWLSVPEPGLALGPLYITLPTTSLTTSPVCIAIQPTTGKVYPFALPTQSSAAALAAANLDQEELQALVLDEAETDQAPSDIHHVWVCTRIPDSQNKVTLRSATGKFLAADEVGQVTAEREARGMLEEWSIEESQQSSGKSLLRSCYGKLLSVDVVAGGKMELRADEENEGETERWRIHMQGEYFAKAKQQILERMGTKTISSSTAGSGRASGSGNGLTFVGDLGKAEEAAINKFQARIESKFVGTAGDVSQLKKAKKQGKLAEAMLDRRMKLKSDRYC